MIRLRIYISYIEYSPIVEDYYSAEGCSLSYLYLYKLLFLHRSMPLIQDIINFIFHFDRYLGSFIQSYGPFTYFFLFLIIFFETGLVLTPFLPGDSLLFVTGTFAAQGLLNVFLTFFLLSLAAILGDTMNYWIGRYFGEHVFLRYRFFKKEYLERTNLFYARHGGKTIFIARFFPIFRTFAPFVAGVSHMQYGRFFLFNFLGGVLWVGVFLFGGYLFGTLPFVQNNFTLVILIIVFLSLLPPFLNYMKRHFRRNGKKEYVNYNKNIELKN